MVRSSDGLPGRVLYARAIGGDPDAIAELGMEADTMDEEGETILHSESRDGYYERVQFILRKFPNKNLLVKLNRLGQTALHLAADHGHVDVVEALIEAARQLPDSSSADDGTDNPVSSFQDFIRQAGGPTRNTALHLAVINENAAIVNLLVEADPDDSHVQNDEGETPIYIAAENGYEDIVEIICTTCTALSLDGPGGRTTALHALLQNIEKEGGARDMIRMIIHVAKRCSSADFEAFFGREDELGSTVLQLAVEKNCVDAVRLILQEDPAYQHGREIKRNGLMRLIFKAIDNKLSDDIVQLLSQTYQVGISPQHKDVLELILAIKRCDEDSVLRLLEGAKDLVTFTDDNGWTALHYAVYHKFDSVLGAIIEAQKNVGHQFVYGNKVPSPFHLAVECGYVSTLVRLMQSWPALSSASKAANSPYTVINKDGQNILHLAAAHNIKEMVECILKYCPQMYKDKMLKQQDTNGDTPLHILISHGCFIPQLIKDKGLDTMAKNKNKFTPWDMLYLTKDIVADQVQIKIALDDISNGKLGFYTRKNNFFSSSVPLSERMIKDIRFDEHKKILKDEEDAKLKEDLQRYRQGTNTQIVVSALITTITFTVGFTMPGGLHQSGEVNEGLTIFSKKAAFNAFMIFDAIALLLSTCSLFIYFLESMSQNLRQLIQLHATTIVLNIISVMMMMLVFMTGTFAVLSHSLALAITICVISSFFFVFVIIQLLRVVYDRRVQRNKDHKHEA